MGYVFNTLSYHFGSDLSLETADETSAIYAMLISYHLRSLTLLDIDIPGTPNNHFLLDVW